MAQSFSTPEAVARSVTFFRGHLPLLAELRVAALARGGCLWNVASALIQGAEDTAHSLALLLATTHVRASFILSRALFEASLTTLFVLAGGEARASKAERHAKQKAIRDLSRKSTIGGRTFSIKWQGTVDLAAHADLREALTEFTGKKGQELRDWTLENVEQQIEAIGTKYGDRAATALQVSMVSVFRHGAEAAHGTLFSVLHLIGALDPAGPPQDEASYDRHRCTQLAFLGLTMGYLLSALVSTIADELGVAGIDTRIAALWAPIQEAREGAAS